MLKNDPASRDLGKVYAARAPEYMAKEMGQTTDLSQFAMFHVSAVSWLMAQGFATVLEKAGIEEAERYLALVMSSISAAVRLKGAPVMLTMQARMDPVDEEPPQTPEKSRRCECRLGDDKECQTCPKTLKVEYQGFIRYLIDYLGDMERKTAAIETFCKPCGARYADQVLSEIVKEGISPGPEPEPKKQQAVAIALETIRTFGVSQAPLTVEALQGRQG